ncbi:MAG: glycosyltransferase family 2 protein [Rhodanobacter sp.]
MSVPSAMAPETQAVPIAASVGSLVSVVMPVYNAQSFLRASVESVLCQTHREWELIAVDDGSSDGSHELLMELARQDSRLRVIRLATNSGVAAARNAGLAVAEGGHVAFLDSDDRWHPRKLEWQLAQMLQTGARVSYAAYDRVTPSGTVLSRVRPPATVTYADMLKSNYICLSTGMYDRSLGDTSFRAIGHEDYVFWLGLIRRAGAAVCIHAPEPLAWYLVRDGSVSSNKLKAARWQWRIYREVEELGWIRAMICMVHYTRHALRKRR